MWRLILSDMKFDYNTVFHQMSEEVITMANIALDMYIKAKNNKPK